MNLHSMFFFLFDVQFSVRVGVGREWAGFREDFIYQEKLDGRANNYKCILGVYSWTRQQTDRPITREQGILKWGRAAFNSSYLFNKYFAYQQSRPRPRLAVVKLKQLSS